MFGVRFLDLDFIGVKRCFSTSSDQVISFEQSIPMEKLPARPTEDRRRDRAEGAKAACEGYRHLEGGKVPRHRDWHGPAHRKGACLKELTPFFVFVAEPLGGPGRGDFLVSDFHPGPIPGNLP